MKTLTFITFGFDHNHEVDGKLFDKDTVAVIQANSYEEGRQIAMDTFGKVWCMEYPMNYFNIEKMEYFPNGFVALNF